MANKQDDWVKIGFGQEARAFKGNPTEIEGMPIIKSNPTSMIVRKPMVVVKRVDWEDPIYDYQGHDLFCIHLAAKLLEELFLKEGKYKTEHIPIPLGSFNDKKAGYYYEYVKGSEGFPFELQGDADVDYRQIPVEIKEWIEFKGPFNDFGFSMESDIADAVNATNGKNIIMSEYSTKELYEGYEKNKTYTLHPFWKRIDFGRSSFLFNYEIFEAEMLNNQTYLLREMGQNYRLALLSAKYYNTNGEMPQKELKKLEGMTELEGMILQFRKRYIL